jgi:hypothetical protein
MLSGILRSICVGHLVVTGTSLWYLVVILFAALASILLSISIWIDYVKRLLFYRLIRILLARRRQRVRLAIVVYEDVWPPAPNNNRFHAHEIPAQF